MPNQSDKHVTAEMVKVEIDESPEMKAVNPGVGARFTARLSIQFSYVVSDEEWRMNREFLRQDISGHMRRAILQQVYGDVWAISTGVRRYMARDTPAAARLNYPAMKWLELLRNIGFVTPEPPNKNFSDYKGDAPPVLAAVLIADEPEIKVEERRIVIAGA